MTKRAAAPTPKGAAADPAHSRPAAPHPNAAGRPPRTFSYLRFVPAVLSTGNEPATANSSRALAVNGGAPARPLALRLRSKVLAQARTGRRPKIATMDQDPAPPVRTSELIRRTAIVTLTVLVIVGLVLVLNEIRNILLWILIGIIFAIALQPGVTWLVRRGVNRVLAALALSLAGIIVIALTAVAIAWPIIVQADDFIRELPSIVTSVFGPAGQLHFLEVRFGVLDRLAAITPEQVASALLGSQDAIVNVLTRAASFVAATITILVIMVMLLIQGSRAWETVLSMLVGEERVWAERIGRDFLRAVGGYVRGNLVISVVAGIVSYIVLRILNVP
jgi:hypothetical protein